MVPYGPVNLRTSLIWSKRSAGCLGRSARGATGADAPRQHHHHDECLRKGNAEYQAQGEQQGREHGVDERKKGANCGGSLRVFLLLGVCGLSEIPRKFMRALVAGAGFEPAIPRLRDYEIERLRLSQTFCGTHSKPETP